MSINKEIKVLRESGEHIQALNPGEIFVFGSNMAGIHGAGAAFMARKLFRAEMGVGIGMTGNCYAIPTKDAQLHRLSIDAVSEYVKEFIEVAKDNPDKDFLVTEIGCGLARFSYLEIAPLFRDALELENVYLPKSFLKALL